MLKVLYFIPVFWFTVIYIFESCDQESQKYHSKKHDFFYHKTYLSITFDENCVKYYIR